MRLARLLAPLLCAALAGCAQTTGSIGAVLGRDDETRALHVRDVPEGLAAEKAGLVPGDEIIMIDGVYVRELPVRELKRLLRGDVGSTVELTIVRGREVLRVRLARTPFRELEVRAREERLAP